MASGMQVLGLVWASSAPRLRQAPWCLLQRTAGPFLPRQAAPRRDRLLLRTRMVNLLHHRTTPRWVSAEQGQVQAIELTRPQPQVLVVASAVVLQPGAPDWRVAGNQNFQSAGGLPEAPPWGVHWCRMPPEGPCCWRCWVDATDRPMATAPADRHPHHHSGQTGHRYRCCDPTQVSRRDRKNRLSPRCGGHPMRAHPRCPAKPAGRRTDRLPNACQAHRHQKPQKDLAMPIHPMGWRAP